jgi:hypothetical protein
MHMVARAVVSNSCLIIVRRREVAWLDNTRNDIEQSALVGYEPRRSRK